MDDFRKTFCNENINKQRCQKNEIEATKSYVEKIDRLIQMQFSKDTNDQSKMNTLVGFIEIREMLNKRINRLFQENVVCPDELNQIKQEYM